MWQQIKNFLIQIITAFASYLAGKQQAELEQLKNEIKIKEDQIAIASRPDSTRESLLERMCNESGVSTAFISDTESRDDNGTPKVEL
jgi:hypothetical protein